MTVGYLDYAGAGRFSQAQLTKVLEEFSALTLYGNPHGNSSGAQHVRDLVEQIRFRVLSFFHTNSQHYSVVFTSGCTAALKMVAECFRWQRCDQCAQHANKRCSFALSNGSSIDTPAFCYTLNNHTSVVGMREYAKLERAHVYCMRDSEIFDLIAAPLTAVGQKDSRGCRCRSLFAYPAQSNFCGKKYPLDWIARLQEGALGSGEWFVCLDAAALVCTSALDLSQHQPDFITLSFYKLFGYPTGLGALLVRNASAHLLAKRYFGGGTVAVAVPGLDVYVEKERLSERLEDGTVSYLDIIALRHGFDAMEQTGGMNAIAAHTHALAVDAFTGLQTRRHANGLPVAVVYSTPSYTNSDKQGPILNFNFLLPNGSYVGYSAVSKIAMLYGIELRTGCFCNQGACQHYLTLSDADVVRNFQSGKVCGDEMDIVDGRPLGSVRISFGYQSSRADLELFFRMVDECFIDGSQLNASNQTIQQKDCCLSYEREGTAPVCRISSDAASYELGLLKLTHVPHTALLTRLLIYPVKSCQGVEVRRWPLSTKGLLHDREFMITSAEGAALTQQKVPTICGLKCSFDGEKALLVSAPHSCTSCSIPLSPDHGSNCVEHREAKLCMDNVLVLDCGDDVANWLVNVLGNAGCRMVRHVSRIGKTDVSLVNEAQFLLITMPSVRRLLTAVHDADPTSGRFNEDDFALQFRPNLVVDGCGEAFEEESWSSLRIGDLTFDIVGRCTRCLMICIDQLNGARNPQVLRCLRKLRGGQLTFGVYLQARARPTAYDASGYHDAFLSAGDRVLPFYN